VKRRGRPGEGYLSEDAALAVIPSVVAGRAAEQAEERERRQREQEREVSFEEIAAAWLAHRVNVVGIKRTTLNHYRTMLARPDDAPRKRGRAPRARIMSRFAGRPAAAITTREMARWLHELDADPLLSARAVNQHRQVLCSIYRYACREDTFGLAENPADRTEKRREADPGEIVTYTPAEVEAIARAAAMGAHRDNRLKLTPGEVEARAQEDAQDACLILVAAFCGLRMGGVPCVALAARDVGGAAAARPAQLRARRGGQSEGAAGAQRAAGRPAGAGAGAAVPAGDVRAAGGPGVLFADRRAPRRIGAAAAVQGGARCDGRRGS
jgi:hypothetical protein